MATRGRPRTLEKDAALETAMLTFWQRGFEETGVDDLVRAMGISTSSLYSIFGDKEALFLSALDLTSPPVDTTSKLCWKAQD